MPKPLKFIPTYRAECGDEIQFVPVDDAPGFSHRVIINRRRVDWLANEYKPSAKSAAFFYEKHAPISLGQILLGAA